MVRDPLARALEAKGEAQLHDAHLFFVPRYHWADCAEIWLVVRHQLAGHLTNVNGGTGARIHMRTPFPYLGNGWADCADTWCVVRGPL